MTPKQLEEKAEELRVRELQLARREQDLAQREQMVEAGMTRQRKPNWPRWPKPLVHQNIQEDIPAEPASLQSLVKRAFIGWYVTFAFLVWNLVAMIGALAVEGAVGDFILAIVYIFIWSSLTFLFYRCFYNAARKNSGFRYWMFFVLLGFQILCHIFWAIGVVGSGMGGFLWMIHLFQDKNTKTGAETVGFFCLVDFIMWALMSIFNVYLWIHVRVYYTNRPPEPKPAS